MKYKMLYYNKFYAKVRLSSSSSIDHWKEYDRIKTDLALLRVRVVNSDLFYILYEDLSEK